MTSVFSGVNPGGKAFMRQKLFYINPAPVSSTIASATSAVTRNRRMRSLPPGADEARVS